jgi:predicted metal-dependent enzyme (double-stranded beta helix superfamily)
VGGHRDIRRERGECLLPEERAHHREVGGKSLTTRDVLLLGDDVIHSVNNPLQSHTGAIHVYGGDFIRAPRSQWPPETLIEEPYDLEAVRHEFSRAEKAASVRSDEPL